VALLSLEVETEGVSEEVEFSEYLTLPDPGRQLFHPIHEVSVTQGLNHGLFLYFGLGKLFQLNFFFHLLKIQTYSFEILLKGQRKTSL
jgi:hypothetical protein